MSFKYQVIKRPRRRTVSISVKPDCSVHLLVPSGLSDKKITELIREKSRWIKSKIAYFQEIQKNHKEKQYVSGEHFTYLDKNYSLKTVQSESNEQVKLVNGRFNVPVPSALRGEERTQLIIERLSGWYQTHALVHLEKKARRYALQVGKFPASVGIKGYATRWGSCHFDGRVYFNWRIIMAPHSVVDYLVVHELCHLVHHDHSGKFWKLVESVLPDYIERRKWLKVNGRELTI